MRVSALPARASRNASASMRVSSLPALRHRVLLNFEGEAEGIKTDQVNESILKNVSEGKAGLKEKQN